MPPDLNSLPPSSPSPIAVPTATPLHPRVSPTDPQTQTRTMSQSPAQSHTPPHSLAAAATMNAGIQHEDARRQSSGSMRREVERARRRSSIRMHLNLNDPGVPAPGEMQRSPSSRSRQLPWPVSPHHERAPSLGDLHQELEYEQEGQVNRLLHMIRQQQSQIQQLQTQSPGIHASSSAVDDSTPTSERSMSIPRLPSTATSTSVPHPAVPGAYPAPNPRADMSRQSSFASRSRNSSQAVSPAMRPTSSASFALPHESTESLPPAALTFASRDESAFYQAETQNLTRENQMLKQRIRELERLLAEANPTSPSPAAHEPATASNLHTSPPVSHQQISSTS